MTAGRPRSEMTDEACEAILRTVALGMYPDRAAEAHGINKSTLRAHKKRNPEFATALKAAESKAESEALNAILLHFPRQWTAAAWLLERRWPERWAKRELPASSGEVRELAAQLRAAANSAKLSVPDVQAKEGA